MGVRFDHKLYYSYVCPSWCAMKKMKCLFSSASQRMSVLKYQAETSNAGNKPTATRSPLGTDPTTKARRELANFWANRRKSGMWVASCSIFPSALACSEDKLSFASLLGPPLLRRRGHLLLHPTPYRSNQLRGYLLLTLKKLRFATAHGHQACKFAGGGQATHCPRQERTKPAS